MQTSEWKWKLKQTNKNNDAQRSHGTRNVYDSYSHLRFALQSGIVS